VCLDNAARARPDCSVIQRWRRSPRVTYDTSSCLQNTNTQGSCCPRCQSVERTRGLLDDFHRSFINVPYSHIGTEGRLGHYLYDSPPTILNTSREGSVHVPHARSRLSLCACSPRVCSIRHDLKLFDPHRTTCTRSGIVTDIRSPTQDQSQSQALLIGYMTVSLVTRSIFEATLMQWQVEPAVHGSQCIGRTPPDTSNSPAATDPGLRASDQQG